MKARALFLTSAALFTLALVLAINARKQIQEGIRLWGTGGDEWISRGLKDQGISHLHNSRWVAGIAVACLIASYFRKESYPWLGIALILLELVAILLLNLAPAGY
jgi:hypothetical protein